jgi:ferrous iron transport protein A
MTTLKPGEIAKIKAIHRLYEFRERLRALGIIVGSKVQLIRMASFNGPLHIRIGTTDLIIRKSEAQHIEIEKENPCQP